MRGVEIFEFRLKEGVLRWLNATDFRHNSNTYGICDRDYWAWKLKPFANGTLQAGISAFLDSAGWLGFDDNYVQQVVRAVVHGTRQIQRSNGSFEEAYPLESSFAVTGLVQFNLAYSFLKYPQFFDSDSSELAKEILLAGKKFVESTPETHGVISNHLATSLLSLDLTRAVFGGDRDLSSGSSQFLNTQNEEGWFMEYSGPDPGYQSLLNHYLFAANEVLKSDALDLSLQKSQEFVGRFCSPIGRFAGEIGARGTSILYPSGLSSHYWNWFCEQHNQSMECVSPSVSDSGNFVPILNSWAIARNKMNSQEGQRQEGGRYYAPVGGMLVDQGADHFLMMNLKNGSLKLDIKEQGEWKVNDLVSLSDGSHYSQLGTVTDRTIQNDKVILEIQPVKFKQELMKGWKMMVVILVGQILYPFPFLQRWFKKMLASRVMGAHTGALKNSWRLEITFGGKTPVVKVQENVEKVTFGFFQHMASANTIGRLGK